MNNTKVKKHRVLHIPFDVSYHLTVHGITASDGVPTVTSQMIRDKVIGVLEHALMEKWIRGYKISAQIDNIEESKKVIQRSKQK